MSIRGYYLALTRDVERDFPFTIHGLWPQYDADHWPLFREPCGFDLERLGPLLPRLRTVWRALRGPDEHFWQQEWLKHGMCTGMPEVEYFTRTLECYEQAKTNGIPWVSGHFAGRTYNIPVDLQWNVGP